MRAIARLAGLVLLGLPVLFVTVEARSQSEPPPTAEELAAQIGALKQDYESRISALEAQLEALEAEPQATDQQAADHHADAAPAHEAPSQDNAFNPGIGVVLNGMARSHSADESEIAGFQIGHESERPDEGLTLGHSELAMSGSIDDKFRGNLTLGFGVHAGEPTEVELEEAYVQTLPGAGLPDGFRVKAGRALWTFGYLNEQHAHEDDFSDRPLPYRAFLDGAYNDDGLEFALVLPTDLYGEVGGGLFRGDDTPFGGSEDGRDAWSAYARLGGDVGRDSAWRIGAYALNGEASNRRIGAVHAHEEEDEHEHEGEEEAEGEEEEHEEHDHAEYFTDGAFTGDTALYGVDLRYTLAPTGNARDSELILQGEYFWRRESGSYVVQEEHEECEDAAPVQDGDPAVPVCETHLDDVAEALDGDSSGWYAQAIYKFHPRWRVGARYARLVPPRDAELDHDPNSFSAMIDWTNSEFGRIRAQYNREDLSGGERDDQVILQYIMSLGAHAAHSF